MRADAPLRGFRVLDACDELGVYATRLLVNLGADVIRVEPPGGDPMRSYPPLVEGVSLYFEHFNAGKRSLTLDLTGDTGFRRLGRLVATAHAVVESGHPDALLSTRVGVDRLERFRPGLVLVSVTPFGREGAHSHQRGSDLTIAAESGLLALNGRPEGSPYRPGGEQTAHMAGLLAANATLLGILDQQRTGRGARLEVPANFAATLATLQTANANFYSWRGRVPSRRGIGSPWFRLLHEAADGWVAIQPLPGQWDSLVALLSAHDAVEDLAAAEYQDATYRQQHYDHVNDVIGAFTRRHPKQYLFEAAQRAGVACVPVNTPADIVADPYLAERGFFREVEHPRLGRLRDAGPPFRFAGRKLGVRTPAPEAGQDDEAIGIEELGLVDAAAEVVMHGGDPAWLPLRGVRVLDFTWMIAGPLGTRLLATFGADVIKIESYNRVDRVRETGPHPDGPWSYNEDGSFNDVNLGKRTILLNLGYPEGQAIARRLAAVSDVVAANFTGDRLDRWNLGFDDLVRVQPNLIFLNMPVFESAGPRRRWTGIGSHINALAGINAISGFAEEPPIGLGPLYPDFSGNPFHATAAILSALVDRDRGAGAQLIEVSQYESTAGLLGPALLQQAVTGAGPLRAGNRSDRACPHNVYPCAGTPWDGATPPAAGATWTPPPSPGPDDDRWCAIEVTTDEEWSALCRVLGRNDWARDARFATEQSRHEHEDVLDSLIAAETPHWKAEALAARLQAVGVAAAPVNRLDHVLADPWYRAEYFSELNGPEGCLFTTHGEPIRPFGRKQPVSRAPMLGEHTEDVLGPLLGLTPGEVTELYAAGVLG